MSSPFARSLSLLLIAWPAAALAQEVTGFRFREVSDKSLGLFQDDKPVLVYNHGLITRPETPRAPARACYVHPLYGLDGETLTDDFARDHPYHRGMYVAWPHIKVGDKEYELWALSGELQQVFQKWVAKDAAAGGATLAVASGWFVGDKQLVSEQMRLDVKPATKDSRAIDIELTWTSLDQPLTLWGAEGKSYGGFNVRFRPQRKTVITVPENAALPSDVTAPAGRTSGDLVVTKLPWADFTDDFSGTGALSGAAIFVDPKHADFPPTWMTRHYGLMSVGWPGVKPQTFPAGQPITCRYRLWIHRGLTSAADIQTAYDEYRNLRK